MIEVWCHRQAARCGHRWGRGPRSQPAASRLWPRLGFGFRPPACAGAGFGPRLRTDRARSGPFVPWPLSPTQRLRVQTVTTGTGARRAHRARDLTWRPPRRSSVCSRGPCNQSRRQRGTASATDMPASAGAPPGWATLSSMAGQLSSPSVNRKSHCLRPLRPAFRKLPFPRQKVAVWNLPKNP